MHLVFRKEIFVNQIPDVLDYFNASPPIQKRINLVVTFIFCLFAAFGAIYCTFFKKKIQALPSAKKNKNTPLNSPIILNQYGISIPKNVPGRSFCTENFKLKNSQLEASETRYKGNQMSALTVTLGGIDDSNHHPFDLLAIMDSKATHSFSKRGVGKSDYRSADPQIREKFPLHEPERKEDTVEWVHRENLHHEFYKIWHLRSSNTNVFQ